MASKPHGIGSFTTTNITAILTAMPKTNGSYAEIAEHVQLQGISLSPHMIAKWIQTGRRDLKEQRQDSPHAQFVQQYDNLKSRYCTTERIRRRELSRALARLNQTGTENDRLPPD